MTAPQRFVQNVFPVIELHNFLFRGPQPSAAELIANNAFHAGIVAPSNPADSWAAGTCQFAFRSTARRRGCETVDPVETLYELASRLISFGIALSEGDVVLAGSPLPLYPVEVGDYICVEWPGRAVVTAEYGGVGKPGT